MKINSTHIRPSVFVAPAGTASPSVADVCEAIRRSCERLAAHTTLPAWRHVGYMDEDGVNTADTAPRQPTVKRGDKITATVTGYVDYIHPDGEFELTTRRHPFPSDTDPGDVVDRFAPGDHGVTWRVDEHAATPTVGDTISGRVVRETPWRRGTILRHVSDTGPGDAYVLMHDGTWTNTDTGAALIEFWCFADPARFTVEYAPGK